MNPANDRVTHIAPEITKKSAWTKWRLNDAWQRYALSLVLVVLTSLIGTFTQHYLSSINLMMLYLPWLRSLGYWRSISFSCPRI